MITLHEPMFDEKDEAYLLNALRSTWVSTGGPFVEQFEREFAKFTGAGFAVSTSNGTIAIQLMLETLKRIRGIYGPFDVIVPTLSFIATANAVVHAGGHPVFADCQPMSLNISVESIHRIIESSYQMNADGLHCSKASGRPLLAVMSAHIMGWLGDVLGLERLCQELQVPLLEDAAESLGSFQKGGRHAGRSGLASAFSFNGNKILTTGGGGMIITDDETFARRAKHLSTTAKTNGLRYEHDEVGYNFRLVNLLAAIGVSQLERFDQTLARKKRIYGWYEESLAGIDTPVCLYKEDNSVPNHWLINAVFPDTEQRESALYALLKRDIQARPLWMPFHLQPALRQFAQPLTSWPHAEEIWSKTLSLPSSPDLTQEKIQLVVDSVFESSRGRMP